MTFPICPKCRKPTKRQPAGHGLRTLMYAGPDYVDENGVWHQSHDPNTTTTDWTCLDCGEVWPVKTDSSGKIISPVVKEGP